jgi:hypothetical protein
MSVPLAEQIVGLFKEGLGAWKTYLSTRQEAYNRQQDKKQVQAIESAEKGFFAMDKIIESLEDLELNKDKKFSHDIKQFIHYRKRFFHYH